MTDMQTPQAAAGAPTPSLISTTLIIYGLYGAAAVIALAGHGFPPIWPLGGIVGLVAIIMAHVKRGGGSPVDMLLRSPTLWLCGLGWLAATLWSLRWL